MPHLWPYFQLSETGPPHMWSYLAQCKTDEIVTQEEGNCKKKTSFKYLKFPMYIMYIIIQYNCFSILLNMMSMIYNNL